MKLAAPVLILTLALSYCQDKEAAAPPPPPRPVLSAPVQTRAAAAPAFAGTVQPRTSTDLGFQILGRLSQREVSVGDSVTKGQLLAALDTLSLEQTVRQATAAVTSAQAELANATATEARQRQLKEKGVAADSDLEAAVQALAAAQSQVASARASLDEANQQLGYARLTAPYDGVVIATNGEVGQVIQAGAPVITVADPEARDAVVDLPDWLTGTLRTGDPFRVALELDPSIAARATVREIAPDADRVTRTRRVKLALDSPPYGFWLGASITAEPADGGTATLSLPAGAVLGSDGKARVWVVDTGKAVVHLRDIKVGPAADGYVPVLAGLNEGERVVTAGIHSLTDGQPVRLDPTPAGAL